VVVVMPIVVVGVVVGATSAMVVGAMVVVMPVVVMVVGVMVVVMPVVVMVVGAMVVVMPVVVMVVGAMVVVMPVVTSTHTTECCRRQRALNCSKLITRRCACTPPPPHTPTYTVNHLILVHPPAPHNKHGCELWFVVVCRITKTYNITPWRSAIAGSCFAPPPSQTQRRTSPCIVGTAARTMVPVEGAPCPASATLASQ